MSATVAELVRIELDTTPYPNQYANHSGQYGRAGSWSTWQAVQGPTLSGEALAGTYNGWALKTTVNPLSTSYSVFGPSVAFTVVAGEYVAIDWTLAPAIKTADLIALVLLIEWLDSADAVTSTDTVILADVGTKVGSPWTLKHITGNRQAPAGAVAGRIRGTLSRQNSSGAAVGVGFTDLYAARLSVTRSSSPGNRLFADPTWTDLTGTSNTIKASRGGDLDGVTDRVEPGLLTAVILDPAADPATNPNMRKGRNVRVRGRATTDTAWQDVMVAQVDELTTEYEKDRTVVTLTGTDVLTTIAGERRPLSWSGSLAQQVTKVLGTLDVPIRVTGSAADTTSEPHTYDKDLNALEQLVRVRDTFGAVLYVDRSGVLNVAQTAPNSGSSTFSDSPADTGAIRYTGIRADFGSRACVNALTVVRRHPNEPDGSKVYGPFENRRSITDWGRVEAEVTILDGDPTTKATTLLRQTATPRPTVHEVSWNAGKAGLGSALGLELYDVARVKFSRAGIDALHRIVGLVHDVTPRGWRVTARFRPLEQLEDVTVVNAYGPNGGLGDLDIPTPGPLASRYRSTPLQIASNAWTSIAWDASSVADGIPYDATNRRFTVPQAGRWLATVATRWATNATGRRLAAIVVNGVHVRDGESSATATLPYIEVTEVLKLAAGDVVSAEVWQNSGASINLDGRVSAETTRMTLTYLGE